MTGSYLFLYTVGILFGEYNGEEKLTSLKYANILALPVLVWSGYRVANNLWILDVFPGWILNPPNVVIMIYALSLSWVVTVAVHYSGKTIQRYILKPISIIGCHSLDIFLFHIPLYILLEPVVDGMGLQSTLTKIIKFIVPLCLPIIVRILYEKTKMWIGNEYKGK